MSSSLNLHFIMPDNSTTTANAIGPNSLRWDNENRLYVINIHHLISTYSVSIARSKCMRMI